VPVNPIALVGGHVVPVVGEPFVGAVILRDGLIAALGPDAAVGDATVIDVTGRWVLPGLIDAHTHLGVHEEGEGPMGNDTNEMTDPNTAQVRALDAIFPEDQGFADAVASGVLAVNVNPGSGNPIGGQTLALRTWGATVDAMVLRSPSGMKSALGENPKRVYGDRKQMPSTRLGTAAVIRQAFADTIDYTARLAAFDGTGAPPARNLKLEALALVLAREIPWRQHCHRVDDIATAIRIASEFGYDLVLDHGTEAHLLADSLAAAGIPVLIGPLLTSRSKMEVRRRSLANPGILDAAGVAISIITDHPVVPIDLLHVQAALAVREGLDPVAALRALTINPGRVMGVDDRLGSLEVGKDASVCVWTGSPIDASSKVLRSFMAGREIYSFDETTRVGTHLSPWAA
jgi:imidazolonepropionase-like amidohydrolase